jgi:hypothetical protein
MSLTPPPENFGRFTKIVADFKLFVTDYNPFLKTCKCADSKFTQPLDIKDNYKQWTITDLNTLASGATGFLYFNGLAKLRNAAIKLVPELDKEKTQAKLLATEKKLGHEMTEAEYKLYQKDILTFRVVAQPETTPDGLMAQKALAHLAPTGKTWLEFSNMIGEAGEKTNAKRKQLFEEYQKYQQEEKAKEAKKGSPKVPSASVQGRVGTIFNYDSGVTVEPSAIVDFDQQKALELLAERGVKVDSDQSHKTPNFEQEALKAVASLKNTVLARAA